MIDKLVRIELDNMYEDLLKEKDTYDRGNQSALYDTDVLPRDKALDYYYASVSKSCGKYKILEKYKYDWVEEVLNNQEKYIIDESAEYDEHGYLTSYMLGDEYEEAINQAEDVNEFFKSKVELIDEVVRRVEKLTGQNNPIELRREIYEDVLDSNILDL